jgi:tRNA pseudouridine38-40 synthase
VAALSKEYRYFFTNIVHVEKKDQKFITNISKKLDSNAMMKCVHAIVGHHDFCNFYSSGSNVKSTTRTIYVCELSEVDPHLLLKESGIFQLPHELRCCYQLRIEANGFLKQMIRHIVSGLWMVGTGKISTDDFINLLNGPKSEKQLWKVASPNGLFLYKIHYQEKVPSP